MQTTVETTEKHTVKLTIEVPADEFAKDLDKTYRAIAREVKVPGFRPGKAPKQIIDAQVGVDVVMEEFVSATVPTYFRSAVTDEDLAPIGSPDVDVEQLEVGKPFIFTATVEVRPRLDLQESDYKGVRATKPNTGVSDEEVDSWVERLQRQFGELETVERPGTEGDYLAISLTATRAGETVDRFTREDYLYAIGSAEFGPELDGKLVGAKTGDVIQADQEFSEQQVGEDLAGTLSFRALVKDVKALKLPEPDDDFAKTASEFDTMAQLRDDLAEKIHEAKEREAAGVIRDRVLQAVVDTIDVDLPESLIDEETTHRVHHAEERASSYGLTLEQMLELQGWDRDRLLQDSREHAVRAIKADLVLEGVARAEGLEVTAEEIGAEIGGLAQAYGRDPKELAKQLDRSGQIVTLAGDIIRTKALDILVEHAEVTEEEPGSSEGAPSSESEEPSDTRTEEDT